MGMIINPARFGTPATMDLAALLGSKLVGWWDASDYSTITETAGVVDGWASKVGGITTSQTTAGNKPGYSATARGGLPGITGDGNDFLTLSALTGFPTGSTEGHIIGIAFSNNSSGDRWIMRYGADSATNRRGLMFPSTSGAASTAGNVTAENQSDAVSTGSSWLNADRIGHARFASGVFGIRSDGGTEVTLARTIATSSTYGRLCSNWNGVIREIIVVNGALTSTEREKIEGYLAHKWGVASLLAGGHPYKSSPPT